LRLARAISSSSRRRQYGWLYSRDIGSVIDIAYSRAFSIASAA
jgi:hypothetical protein